MGREERWGERDGYRERQTVPQADRQTNTIETERRRDHACFIKLGELDR